MRSSRHRKPHDHCWHLGYILPKSAGNHRANRAKKKRKKEEGEPKGVRTSYLFFCEDMREEIDTVSPGRRFEFEFERQEVGVIGSCGAGRPTRRWG